MGMNSSKLNFERINFDVSGSGDAIVLLHGYLENLSIWDDYSNKLSKEFRVLRLDLPGHGKSQCDRESITMDFMAESVSALMNHLNIPRAVIVGHSMGGYAALAFAEKYPEKLAGLCLFHSTPNADSAEKKLSRKSDIDLVINGRSDVIINRNIPNLFAGDNLGKFNSEVERAKIIANSTSDKGILGALKGMAERPDRNAVFENLPCPTMMIFGRKDNLILLPVAEALAERHKKARTVFLNHSGHMGFIEERDQALKAITSFLKRVFM